MMGQIKYTKPFISFQEQIDKLKSRGLIINDNAFALSKLSTISYYRLRAYTYPFQNNQNPRHPFIKKIIFEHLIDLYNFDRELRILIFNTLEKIEIALRTQISHCLASEYGSHWYTDPNFYRCSQIKFNEIIQSITADIARSKEDFIEHYNKKYIQPKLPPSWMTLEVISFGTLSKLYSNLNKDTAKNAVLDFFGLNDVKTLESWMHCFNNTRNICAHHARLWNRRLLMPYLPYNLKNPFLTKNEINTIYPNKIYASLCCMQYMMNTIDSNFKLKDKLLKLFTTCSIIQKKELGFPDNWEEQTIWKK